MMDVMKSGAVLGAILSMGLFVSPAGAQVVYGINGGAAIPSSDFGDIAKTGFGGGAFLGTMVSESIMIKVDGAYWSFKSEEVTIPGFGTFDVTGAIVPIKVGLRKYWGQSKRFFTGPSVGIYIPSDDISDLDSNIGLGPQIGYRFPMSGGGSVDIIAEYHTIFIGDESPLTDDGDREFYDNDKVTFFTIGLGYVFGGPGD
jgi:hypothetical protein